MHTTRNPSMPPHCRWPRKIYRSSAPRPPPSNCNGPGPMDRASPPALKNGPTANGRNSPMASPIHRLSPSPDYPRQLRTCCASGTPTLSGIHRSPPSCKVPRPPPPAICRCRPTSPSATPHPALRPSYNSMTMRRSNRTTPSNIGTATTPRMSGNPPELWMDHPAPAPGSLW